MAPSYSLSLSLSPPVHEFSQVVTVSDSKNKVSVNLLIVCQNQNEMQDVGYAQDDYFENEEFGYGRQSNPALAGASMGAKKLKNKAAEYCMRAPTALTL